MHFAKPRKACGVKPAHEARHDFRNVLYSIVRYMPQSAKDIQLFDIGEGGGTRVALSFEDWSGALTAGTNGKQSSRRQAKLTISMSDPGAIVVGDILQHQRFFVPLTTTHPFPFLPAFSLTTITVHQADVGETTNSRSLADAPVRAPSQTNCYYFPRPDATGDR